MAEIILPYSPRRWALKTLHSSVKRFIVMVIHRRGGKTVASLNHLVRDAMRNKKHAYAYIAPLRNQAKRIAWGILKDIVAHVAGVSINESELTITFLNGSTVSLYGADNADALRGIGLDGVVLDEYAQMSPVIFSEIITKCVADRLGYIIIIGTPKGKGHFHRIYKVAEQSEMWDSVYLNIDDSLKQEHGKTIDNLRQALKDDQQHVTDGLMTQAEFDQEWYLSWEAAIRGAVYGDQIAEARKRKHITSVPYDPSLPVHTVWDLGISKGNAMAIGFVQKPSSRETWLIDYYENIGQGLAHYAAVIKKKPYVYAKHWFPHDVRNREKSTGQALFATAEKLFGKANCEIVEKISIEDGIDLTRAMWSRLWIDAEQCALFEDIIGSYVYEFNDNTQTFRSTPLHNYASNAADMLRYLAVVEDLLNNETLVRKRDDDRRAERAAREPDQTDDEYVGDQLPQWMKDEQDSGPSEDELSKM